MSTLGVGSLEGVEGQMGWHWGSCMFPLTPSPIQVGTEVGLYPHCIWPLPTQLSAEGGVALQGAGEDGGEQQQGDQRQHDGQHQHSSCQDSDRRGHDDPRRSEGKEDKEQLSSSLGTPGQEKGEQLFPSNPTAVPKGRIRDGSLGCGEGDLSWT